MPKAKKINLKPFVTAVDDYHEFKSVIRHFHNAGFELEFEEVGCFKSELWDNHSYNGYHAIFFLKGEKNKAQALIQKWKKESEEYFKV